ncbi:hypothetical protein LCM4577_15180 [Mesorhizobium sp. LCM 4577]|nr:hypothetical protein LCM4577_15180 [Mesorhizobium sp. LCM 4577]
MREGRERSPRFGKSLFSANDARGYAALRALGIDCRTRKARRWAAYYAQFIDQTGGKHAKLVETLCGLLIEREDLQRRQLKGDGHDHTFMLAKVSQSIVSTMDRLGIVKKVEKERRPLRETLMERAND